MKRISQQGLENMSLNFAFDCVRLGRNILEPIAGSTGLARDMFDSLDALYQRIKEAFAE